MKEYLRSRLREALDQMDGVPDTFQPELETPADREHGDLSTNLAMQLASVLGRSPRAIAEQVVEHLRDGRLDPSRVAAVDVAGPGFVNFHYARDYLHDRVRAILAEGDTYGRTDMGSGRRALVEYVSANPTGPLTVGHGRNAVLGDTIANVLEWTGYDVTREYYYNDAGRQMRVLARSVRARYRALVHPKEPTKTLDLDDETSVEVPASFPEDGYLGAYIEDVAADLAEKYGDALLETDALEPFKEGAEAAIFADIERTLGRIGIEMDTFFNERDLYQEGQIWEVVDELRERGYVYDEDGATWLQTTEFDKDKDTVLIKSSGEPTYRLPDIAYHVEKIERGFDEIVDVFGADHIDTIPDVINAVEVLGYDTSNIHVVLYQFVTLVRGGDPVKMSTRKATYVTLDDLMDEVGEDVTRFFFLMRSPNTHLDFDLDRAKEAGEKNPVFYLQYAHARICSILRKAEELGFSFADEPHLERLTHEAEIALIKELLDFPEKLQNVAGNYEPHWIITYLNDVATAFTRFYDNCRIIGQEKELATARMNLARATQTVLRNGLTVLGITAPEKM
jgi:arginyl-tRNA synthetase